MRHMQKKNTTEPGSVLHLWSAELKFSDLNLEVSGLVFRLFSVLSSDGRVSSDNQKQTRSFSLFSLR